MSITETVEAANLLSQIRKPIQPTLDAHIASWVSKNLSVLSLDTLQELGRIGTRHRLAILFPCLKESEVLKLLKKVDKHNGEIIKGERETQIRHLAQLAFGEAIPLAKVNKVPKKRLVRAKASDVNKNHDAALGLLEIANLNNLSDRQLNLKKLKKIGLVEQARTHGLSFPPQVKRVNDMINFVLDEMAKGWPKPISVLDDSQY
jgi:hypothetical protein